MGGDIDRGQGLRLTGAKSAAMYAMVTQRLVDVPDEANLGVARRLAKALGVDSDTRIAWAACLGGSD
eukprot:1116175-Heterocapsa_arctica.AAC.1